jgi:hypothetical protein
MIGIEDSNHTFEYASHYKIMPAIDANGNRGRIKNGQKVPVGFMYTSDKNTEWMSVETLRTWIEAHYAKVTV